MTALTWTVATAILLNGLMAGFLFAFAVVVMPGIQELSDREFLRSFQAIDRVIQNGQPLFVVMWLGSTASLIVAAILATLYGGGIERAVLIAVATASVLLIQAPTMTINIPLNNQVQALDLTTLADPDVQDARHTFEARWLRWNTIRTVVSCLILVALIFIAFRL